MTRLGRNRGRIISATGDFTDAHPQRPVRFAGEPLWSGRSAEEMAEATRREALINLAFGRTPAAILCPYEVSGLPAAMLADARHIHPAACGQLRLWRGWPGR